MNNVIIAQTLAFNRKNIEKNEIVINNSTNKIIISDKVSSVVLENSNKSNLDTRQKHTHDLTAVKNTNAYLNDYALFCYEMQSTYTSNCSYPDMSKNNSKNIEQIKK